MRKKILAIVSILFALSVGTANLSLKVQAQSIPINTFYSSISVQVDNTSKNELYSFLTNISNDQLWYPGISSTILVKKGASNLVGNEYIQSANVNGLITNTTIDVLAAKKNHYFLIQGKGDVASYTALYTFSNINNSKNNHGGIYTLSSVYQVPGLTKDQFTQYISYALSGLLTYYKSTGKVTVNFVIQQ